MVAAGVNALQGRSAPLLATEWRDDHLWSILPTPAIDGRESSPTIPAIDGRDNPPYSVSKIAAMPWPPPMQSDAAP